MSCANNGFAKIVEVEQDSPAYDAGFEPGCLITHVDGHAIADMIDWRWHSSDSEIEVGYIDLDGDSGSVVLEREYGQDWGFTFDGAVFDDVRICRNACTFCFMRQLPKGMRQSLSLRDDDYRLSFLEGTFATFTNLGDADVSRIIEQHISPLRISLHAIDSDVRRQLIGKNAARGIDALLQLMDAGIEFDAQVVLVPGVNDGDVLDETLQWAYEHPQIKTMGIVPLGFTSHQRMFEKSFDEPADALSVLKQISRFQERAIAERGFPWAYAADEFYCNAYGPSVLDHLPPSEFYGDYSMFEDGIGIVRSAVDSWNEAKDSGKLSELARVLEESDVSVRFICGCAMESYAMQLVEDSDLSGYYDCVFVKNRFFGGNVNVTGLLCGCDIADAIKGCIAEKDDSAPCAPEGISFSESLQKSSRRTVFAIPDVVFNDDDVTLDDWTLNDIKGHIGDDSNTDVIVVSSNPLNYIGQISEFVSALDIRR